MKKIILLLIILIFISGCIGSYNKEGFVEDTIEIYGSAGGDDFDHYVIKIGKGRNPIEWTDKGISLIDDGRKSIENDVLGWWDTMQVGDGRYTVKIIVYDKNETVNEDILYFTVDNLKIDINDFINFDGYPEKEYDERFCELPYCLEIRGTVKGTNFEKFTVEYSLSNFLDWSSEGINLRREGKSRVNNDVVAEWDLRNVVYRGKYLIKITVFNNDGSKIEETIPIRIEGSDLVSYPISEIINKHGTSDISGYFIIKIFRNEKRKWIDYDTVIDDLNPKIDFSRYIRTKFPNRLYGLWNGLNYRISEAGLYKIRVSFVDFSGEVIKIGRTRLENEFEFEVLDKEFKEFRGECKDGTKLLECSKDIPLFCNANGELIEKGVACDIWENFETHKLYEEEILPLPEKNIEIKLESVGSSGAIVVSVDGVTETISSGNTETVNGIGIFNKETYYEDVKEQRYAILEISY